MDKRDPEAKLFEAVLEAVCLYVEFHKDDMLYAESYDHITNSLEDFLDNLTEGILDHEANNESTAGPASDDAYDEFEAK